MPENVSPLWYICFMGSSLPYDDTHEPRTIVDCEICNVRFLVYPDGVRQCTDCLSDPHKRKQRNRQSTPIAFLFDS